MASFQFHLKIKIVSKIECFNEKDLSKNSSSYTRPLQWKPKSEVPSISFNLFWLKSSLDLCSTTTLISIINNWPTEGKKQRMRGLSHRECKHTKRFFSLRCMWSVEVRCPLYFLIDIHYEWILRSQLLSLTLGEIKSLLWDESSADKRLLRPPSIDSISSKSELYWDPQETVLLSYNWFGSVRFRLSKKITGGV